MRVKPLISTNLDPGCEQVLDIQDPQEDCVPDGAYGGGEGAQQDLPAVPADVLAPGLQGAHLHQRAGRADEHGGALAPEDRLWPGCRGQPGRHRQVRL